MTERERLIELIKQATISYLDYLESIDQKGLTDTEGKAKFIADYLLANGVVCPPCKVGDPLYCIRYDKARKSFVKQLEVRSITTFGTGKFTVFTTKEDYWGVTAFATNEEAEKALERRKG